MTAEPNRTICLGDEYDEELRAALVRVLRDMGASFEKGLAGMAGSQELQVFEAQVQGKRVVIEIETYVGLSITGEPTLIEGIETRIKASARNP